MKKAHTQARIVPVRVRDEDYRRYKAAAKKHGHTVSEWIRSTLNATVGA